jgi:hypothetical protein
MWALVFWAYGLYPPAGDVDRFPGAEESAAQITRWRRHLTWLMLHETVAPWPGREQIRQWQRQTRAIIGQYSTLEEARSRREQLWEDDCRRALAALWQQIGPDAYAAGALPFCPIVHPWEPWCDP